MDIDEILERAEKVEEKGAEAEEGKELLSAFKASCNFHFCRYFCCSFFLLKLLKLCSSTLRTCWRTFKILWIKSYPKIVITKIYQLISFLQTFLFTPKIEGYNIISYDFLNGRKTIFKTSIFYFYPYCLQYIMWN